MQALPDPCAGPGITYLANVTADLPGVLTYYFAGPMPNTLYVLDTAVFTSIPEPSTFTLLFAGAAIFASTLVLCRRVQKRKGC